MTKIRYTLVFWNLISGFFPLFLPFFFFLNSEIHCGLFYCHDRNECRSRRQNIGSKNEKSRRRQGRRQPLWSETFPKPAWLYKFLLRIRSISEYQKSLWTLEDEAATIKSNWRWKSNDCCVSCLFLVCEPVRPSNPLFMTLQAEQSFSQSRARSAAGAQLSRLPWSWSSAPPPTAEPAVRPPPPPSPRPASYWSGSSSPARRSSSAAPPWRRERSGGRGTFYTVPELHNTTESNKFIKLMKLELLVFSLSESG